MFSIKRERLKRELKGVDSYEEWKGLAKKLDTANGLEAWKRNDQSHKFDYKEIRRRLDKLRKYRQSGDDHALLFTLNEGIHGNMGGMGNPQLYNHALFGTKDVIVDYVEEIANSLLHIVSTQNEEITMEEKIDFFSRASHCFGRSALMLSGGGQLGNFHMGVIKALCEQKLLPNIISGSSAGSIFAALVGTFTDEELATYFEPKNLMMELEVETKMMSLFRQRTQVKSEDLAETLDRIIPNLTFHEAFEKTGRKINISVAPYESNQKSRLLNAIASPNVLIHSAVMASCAIPGIFKPVTLLAKNKDGVVKEYLPDRQWVDGSMSNDLPSKRLTRLYMTNHFIVSLTNPFIIPFVNDKAQKNNFLNAATKFGKAIIQETTQFNYAVAKPFFKYWPRLANVASNLNSVVQQDYTGDINIVADFSVVSPRNLLTPLTQEELTALIRKGEQATWPKIENIRVTTLVGRLLDSILDEYGRQGIEVLSKQAELEDA
ncbi:MAG: TAG lipase/steryl ester hydrolase/phospholipase A2/LPA acyltransferase [Saprospiraceae bacterium]|jgi:TAG lipase/steryl ester hydrolase/phospholipase A2/LPA acyltransferase